MWLGPPVAASAEACTYCGYEQKEADYLSRHADDEEAERAMMEEEAIQEAEDRCSVHGYGNLSSASKESGKSRDRA
jgi:hypothetical protein